MVLAIRPRCGASASLRGPGLASHDQALSPQRTVVDFV